MLKNSNGSMKKSNVMDTKGSINRNKKINSKSILDIKIGNGHLKNNKESLAGSILEDNIDTLNQDKSSLYVPLAPPFSHREYNAHTWSMSVMIKYLVEEMELGNMNIRKIIDTYI